MARVSINKNGRLVGWFTQEDVQHYIPSKEGADGGALMTSEILIQTGRLDGGRWLVELGGDYRVVLPAEAKKWLAKNRKTQELKRIFPSISDEMPEDEKVMA